jgi:hypothetical protein
MSSRAMRALAAAVRLNPAGAELLLNALTSAPRLVRYKPTDRYGPLGMMLSPSIRRRLEGDADQDEVRELLEACDSFRQEWLERGFSKTELAAVLELLLEKDGHPVRIQGGAWAVIRGPGQETASERDPLGSYFSG